MMKDITNSIMELESADEPLVVTEYIYGYRFFIHITENDVHLSQDEEFNKKTFGNILDLNRLWNSIQELYNIDSDRLFHAPIREYTLCCIFYDPDQMRDKLPVYPAKGFMVVEIKPKDGILIYQSRTPEFCEQLRLPCVKTSFMGTKDMLKGDLPELRSLSNLASNKIPYGIVIKNEPTQVDPANRPIRWFIAANSSFVRLDNCEPPADMAFELIRVTFGPERVLELDSLTGVKPTSKKRFSKLMTKWIKDNIPGEYQSYLDRCMPALGNDYLAQFDTLMIEQGVRYIEETVLGMANYTLQAKVKTPRKPRQSKKSKQDEDLIVTPLDQQMEDGNE